MYRPQKNKHDSNHKEFIKCEKLRNKTEADCDNQRNTSADDDDWWADQAKIFNTFFTIANFLSLSLSIV